jgi:NTP pyrophosphatase (non-canonical NTP hydrolase)
MKNNDIIHIQKVIDDTIRTLGGYWSPLSGLARVLEELGELGEIILKKDLGEEFTVCVANQYSARLSLNFNPDVKGSRTLQEHYLSLMSKSGELARILNSYEGNKKLKKDEHPNTVEKQVSLICSDIISIANSLDIDLIKSTEQKMLTIRKRDKDRFDTLYDPTLSRSHDEYISINKTDTKVWGLRDSAFNSLKEDLLNNADVIRRFLKFGAIERIDSLVIKVDKNNYEFQDLGEYNNDLLGQLENNFVILRRKAN